MPAPVLGDRGGRFVRVADVGGGLLRLAGALDGGSHLAVADRAGSNLFGRCGDRAGAVPATTGEQVEQHSQLRGSSGGLDF